MTLLFTPGALESMSLGIAGSAAGLAGSDIRIDVPNSELSKCPPVEWVLSFRAGRFSAMTGEIVSVSTRANEIKSRILPPEHFFYFFFGSGIWQTMFRCWRQCLLANESHCDCRGMESADDEVESRFGMTDTVFPDTVFVWDKALHSKVMSRGQPKWVLSP
jgi:hypothetical protein